MKVKIYGAGSIGNHLSFAATKLGWNVDVYDIDVDALYRMKHEIFPSRYGKWNDNINLFNNLDLQKNKNIKYDYVFIGTPPDTHLDILEIELKNKPKGILVEKPVCRPNLKEINKVEKIIQNSKTRIFVGYNHVISEGVKKVTNLVKDNAIGKVLTIDVEFRENWKGIFDAHPWLNGPGDSYLGFWERGGGASGEHSHALNLWQYFVEQFSLGKVNEINYMLDYKNESNLIMIKFVR